MLAALSYLIGGVKFNAITLVVENFPFFFNLHRFVRRVLSIPLAAEVETDAI